MTLDSILLGIVAWAVGMAAVFAVFLLARDCDPPKKSANKRHDAEPDPTITHYGHA